MEGKQEEDREEKEAEEEARGRAASGSREQGQHVEKDERARCCCTLRAEKESTNSLSGTHSCTKLFLASQLHVCALVSPQIRRLLE